MNLYCVYTHLLRHWIFPGPQKVPSQSVSLKDNHPDFYHHRLVLSLQFHINVLTWYLVFCVCLLLPYKIHPWCV